MRKKIFTFLLALAASVGMSWATENSIVINGTPQVGDNSISLTYYFDPANVPGICCYAPTLKVKCVTDNLWDEKWLDLGDISSGTETITLDNLGSFQAGKSYDVCFAYNNGGWVDDVFQSFTPAEPQLAVANTLQLHVNDALMGSVAVTNLLGSGIVDNGDGTYTVPEGAEVTLLATPNEGYEFTGWKASSSICDFNECEFVDLHKDENPLTFDMNNEVAFMAEFAAVAPQDQDVDITPNVDPQHANVYYSTFFDSSVKYELPAGVEAYVADLSGANLLLSKIADASQTIPANVAVILKSTVTPFTLTVSDADAVTFTATNDLQGSDIQIATPANCYVLGGADGVVGFYQYSASHLNPHKAYVIYAPSQNQAPRRMPFVFNQATGVEDINAAVESIKRIENGQLIIIKNGVKYNAQGKIVK